MAATAQARGTATRQARWRCRAVAALAGVLLAGAAAACGPYARDTLLGDRLAALTSLPEGVFGHEARQLVRPTDDLREQRWQDPEQVGLPAAHAALLQAMRAAAGGPAADRIGSGLPDALRLYTSGAVAWHQGDLDYAERQFQAVLQLPAAQARPRAVRAAWMLGRLALRRGDGPAAFEWFGRVRALRTSGAPDPDDLAIASFGAQAGWHLARGEWAAAVAGYAEQAARERYGSGRDSLLVVARRLLRDPDALALAITDPLVQKLLGAYAWSRSHELIDDEPEYGPDIPGADHATAIDRIAAAADRAGLQALAGADRLAAAAYLAGRFELAQRLLPWAEGPLAHWIDAKLKFRAGDLAGGTAALALASRAFDPAEIWADQGSNFSYELQPSCRIAGELAILQLQREDYLQAADLLYDAGLEYWDDLAYVAERVLSSDELLQLVRRRAPAAVPLPAGRQPVVQFHNWLRLQPDFSRYGPLANRLRWLAARRLLRAGRHAEAIPLFDDPLLRAQARQYAAALDAAAATRGIERARRLAEAAALARAGGELLFESLVEAPPSAARLPLHGSAEPLRLAASQSGPWEQHHGDRAREIAAAHALAAADLVPPRSQAHAALLCRATGYLVFHRPEVARQIYQRYLREGAYVPWGAAFGRGSSQAEACPPPDFNRLELQQRAQNRDSWRRAGLLLAPLCAALLLVLRVLRVRWRRRR